jgi:phage I-like protein
MKTKIKDIIDGLPEYQKDIWLKTFNKSIESNTEKNSISIANETVKASETFYYTISLSEEKNNKIEIMRTGKWKHNIYGLFEITNNTIDNIITNFKNKVRGIDISFDLEHGDTAHKGEAVCWVKNLIKKGNSLLAEVEWTKFGKEKIKEKSFKYFSPEFKFVYTDSETGKIYNNVLLGGGLTNRPFIKNMSPIMLSETIQSEFNSPCILVKNKEDIEMNKELLKALKLSEEATNEEISNAINNLIETSNKLSEIETELTTLKAEKAIKETEITTLKADKLSLSTKLSETLANKSTAEQENIALKESVEAIQLKLKESDWESIKTIALNEGKLTPAMVDVFKTQYMVNPEATKQLIDCLQPVVALNEKGSSNGNDEVSHLELFNKEVKENMIKEKLDYEKALIFTEKNNPSLFKLADNERKGY